MRSTSIPALIAAFFMAAMLTGCYPYYGGSYDDSLNYGPNYSASYYGRGIYRHGDVYSPYPRHRPYRYARPHRSHRDHSDRHRRAQLHGDRRDWRDGDGAFRRRQRDSGGISLEERNRRDLGERLREGRRDGADRARVQRRERAAHQRGGQAEIQTRAGSENLDRRERRLSRRQERATRTERDAQHRAAEVRRQLRAERQAERESLPLQPAPRGGAQIER